MKSSYPAQEELYLKGDLGRSLGRPNSRKIRKWSDEWIVTTQHQYKPFASKDAQKRSKYFAMPSAPFLLIIQGARSKDWFDTNQTLTFNLVSEKRSQFIFSSHIPPNLLADSEIKVASNNKIIQSLYVKDIKTSFQFYAEDLGKNTWRN